MDSRITSKLKKLPPYPGIYFHKNKAGEIIYIGKAANLRNRVRQYFHPSTTLRVADAKTAAMVKEIADIDWQELETEVDALFIEAEMVRRYQPPYNILLRDDKSLQYVRIDIKSDYPTVKLVRRPLDDGAKYFGPYANGYGVKKALRYLRRAFPYAISRPTSQKRVSLHYHLGLDPGLEEGRTSLIGYRANLRKLMQYLRGDRKALVISIEAEMKKAAKAKEFEQAAALRNQAAALHQLSRQVLFSDREIADASRDYALVELAKLLNLNEPPKRIEGFDISHIQGSDTAGSMVVFSHGLPEKTAYRKFKMRLPGNDDFGHMYETLKRRFKAENVKKWGLPDLVLIDGGKGQLSAALAALDEQGFASIPCIGLAKRHEDIILKKPTVPQQPHFQEPFLEKAYARESGRSVTVSLPENSHLLKLLQRIRDESHRFAVSYHTSLRKSRAAASILDDIPGVGDVTRKKLIRHFGSGRAALNASPQELKKLLGARRGQKLAEHFATIV